MRTLLLSLLALSCAPADKAGGGDSASPIASDADRDGFFGDEDCNEGDASVHAGATELCDGVDNNCDGEVDEGVRSRWYADEDGDGFGDPAVVTESCAGGEGLVNNDSDCDDGSDEIFPGAEEVCDGLDNDCDDTVDDGVGATWYADGDGDGYGDPASPFLSCEAPADTVANSLDCDDSSAASAPGLLEVCDELDNDCDGEVDEDVENVFYEDRDGDGYGLSGATAAACAPPEGYSAEGGDCDDDDPLFYPGAAEGDCADPNDYNCDGSVGYADADLDSFAACLECDDSDPLINPAALEICDDLDNDCDGAIDDADSSLDPSTTLDWYEDADGDGYGDPAGLSETCDPTGGAVADATDCDDGDATTSPGAPEVCDGFDDDCDGLVDDADPDVDTSTGSIWYADGDGDGYGDAGSVAWACTQPVGFVGRAGDCDDSLASVSPAGQEVCGGSDEDCDGLIDDADPSVDLSSGSVFYDDDDSDGYGDAGDRVWSCLLLAGAVAVAGDCDDTDASVSPGDPEVCDGVDDDCDGLVDDEDPSVDLSTGIAVFADVDADGYGDPGDMLSVCEVPAGYLEDDGDCDDGDAFISPAADEVCDAVDNDCDGLTDDDDGDLDLSTADPWYGDGDGDGYGGSSLSALSCVQPAGTAATADDCADADPSIHPGAAESWDCVDQDCDGFELPIGDGRDGALTVGTQTQSHTATTILVTPAGSTSLTVASSTGLSAGDLLFVFASSGSGAGSWEVVTVASVSGTTVQLEGALAHSYGASTMNQVVRIPQYSTVTVPSGSALSAPDWAGASGGGLLTFVAQRLSLSGTLSAAGAGFRGGAPTYNATQVGQQGEGVLGTGGYSTSANGMGGGGGSAPSFTHANGGGGGHASAGATGSAVSGYGNTGGTGGGTAGSADLSTLLFGGGGGAGGLDADPGGGSYGGAGGDGGGIVLVSVGALSFSGAVTAAGARGGDGVYTGGASPGGGGGGAGGAIFFGASTMSTASGSFSATGASGGSGSEAGAGVTTAGSGGDGSVRLLLPGTVTASPSAYLTCP